MIKINNLRIKEYIKLLIISYLIISLLSPILLFIYDSKTSINYLIATTIIFLIVSSFISLINLSIFSTILKGSQNVRSIFWLPVQAFIFSIFGSIFFVTIIDKFVSRETTGLEDTAAYFVTLFPFLIITFFNLVLNIAYSIKYYMKYKSA